MFQPRFKSEEVTNLNITISFFTRISWIYTSIKTPISKTGVLNCFPLNGNYQQNNRVEGKNPTEIKGLVIKWQLAPFRNAAALEADPLQLVATVFTGKRKI